MRYDDEDDDLTTMPVDEDYVPTEAAGSPRQVEPPLFAVPQRSAGLLVWGVLLIIVSTVALQVASTMTLDWALSASIWRRSDPGQPVRVGSVIGGIVGLICLCVGMWRMATSVDYIAHMTHVQEHAEKK